MKTDSMRRTEKALESAIHSIIKTQNFDGFKVLNRIATAKHADAPTDLQVKHVAEWYKDQPRTRHTERTADAYAAFRRECILQYDALTSALDVDLCSIAEPYESAQSMRSKVLESGRLDIRCTRTFSDLPDWHALNGLAKRFNGSYVRQSSRYNDAPVLTYNDAFRAVHDGLTHVLGGENTPFDLHGEFRAVLMHSTLFSRTAQPALWNEAFAQICRHDQTGQFPSQKMNAFPLSWVDKFQPWS